MTTEEFVAFLEHQAEVYDREGGGGNQFRSRLWRHARIERRTAAREALVICRKLYPWRLNSTK